MTVATNSAEGGSNGTTVTTGNSGGASGDAFDLVTIGTTGAITFDNAFAHAGSLAVNVTSGGTGAISYVEWSTAFNGGSSVVQVWFRAYVYITAKPANDVILFMWRNTGDGVLASVQLVGASGAPTVNIHSWNNVVQVGTGAQAVAVNSTVRFDDVAVSTTGYLGPLSTGYTSTVTDPAGLSDSASTIVTSPVLWAYGVRMGT